MRGAECAAGLTHCKTVGILAEFGEARNLTCVSHPLAVLSQ